MTERSSSKPDPCRRLSKLRRAVPLACAPAVTAEFAAAKADADVLEPPSGSTPSESACGDSRPSSDIELAGRGGAAPGPAACGGAAADSATTCVLDAPVKDHTLAARSDHTRLDLAAECVGAAQCVAAVEHAGAVEGVGAVAAVADGTAPAPRSGVGAASGERWRGVRVVVSGGGTRLLRRVILQEVARQLPCWLLSVVVHMVGVLLLAATVAPLRLGEPARPLTIAPLDLSEFDALDEFETDHPREIEVKSEVLPVDPNLKTEVTEIAPPAVADDLDAAPLGMPTEELGATRVPQRDLLAAIGAFDGAGLAGRASEVRAQMVRKYGGNEGSEAAVARALQWLAAHQLPDGGWSFAHPGAPHCRGQCRNPGKLAEARNGATALALLPFLGAGQTHRTGTHRATIRRAVEFLVSRMRPTADGGSYHEPGGQMYSHGLAAIALCEAYAMSRDRTLAAPAQEALRFVCAAQDPVGGGWRYWPRQRGDTSVVGWQIMALKSGHLAYLNVPGSVCTRAGQFLDGVQTDSGARYGYIDPGAGPATTAIGLLCRMYLGWPKDHPALVRGVQWLGDQGPSGSNLYYNYYATQVLCHWQGPLWTRWNGVMRDQLVNAQAKQGHEQGSWYVGSGDHGSAGGGRLYCTAMSAMILEVYYRQMPIYRLQSTAEHFPE